MVPTQDDSKATTKFRVAICGGGIAGICLALSLSKYPDIQVDLYEAAARFTEIGAGLTVQGRTWKPLELMGVDATLRKAAAAANNVATSEFSIRDIFPF
ncbi:hypothetical protein PHLCEN_2v10861 [Hermanssonia centrifuga]|uniref:Uncharacterized protein n=1 Tax=Hermanssonia centrifuga TaxID=98765 RepID=A0A2R6NLS7_9APHY|nr:hypothetical protein PHLCEN_2v10861 [Hermanssonia centrifuga]